MDAIIKGDTAILMLQVKIPKHYYEFFEFLEEAHSFNLDILAEMAADGIIMDANNMQEALDNALDKADVSIRPELPVGSRNFKQQTQNKE